jgi:hypothetical protein
LTKSGSKSLLNFVFLSLIILFAAACANTIVPRNVSTDIVSWDGNEQNGGFIDFTDRGGGIITPNARNRYNILISIYSTNFIPPLKFDDGITSTSTNTFLIDAQHLSNFATMNRWHKSKRNP